jgi:hypothetical protein
VGLRCITIQLGIAGIAPPLDRTRARCLIFASNPGPGDKMPSPRQNADPPKSLSPKDLARVTAFDGIFHAGGAMQALAFHEDTFVT